MRVGNRLMGRLRSKYQLRLRGSSLITAPPPQPSVITSFPIGNLAGQMPDVHVRDITNGYDLYTRNADTQNVYPASTVKFMTMLLAREYHSQDWTTGTVTVTAADVTQPSFGTVSFAGLQANDVVTWEELAYGLAVVSGGDCCQAIARIIGTEIFVAGGSTGSTGMTRFIERMNSRAVELGMTNTTYTDPFGGSKTFAPDTVRNVLSPRDLTTVCARVYVDTVARGILGTTAHGLIVTGVNARTISMTNVISLLNGPIFAPSGVKDANIVMAKTGTWVLGSPIVNAYNMSLVWTSPAGYKVVVTVMGSESDFNRWLDVRGLINSLIRDFPYLNAAQAADSSFSSVKLLIGADGSVIDESLVGRTLVNTSVPAGAGIVSTGGAIINNVNDDLHCADAADLVIGAGDFTIETWWAGAGSAPSGGVEYVFFLKAASGQREFAANSLSGGFNIFASTDGTNWITAVAYTLAAVEQPVFFNGAPRHLALRKSGTNWALYLNGDKMQTTVTAGTIFNGTADLSACPPGSAPIGSIDEFRATYGVARYTAEMVSLIARKFPRS